MNLRRATLKPSKCLFILVFLLSSFYTMLQAQDMVIQRVRLDFTAPNGAVRQILLGFTSNDAATDGFDYGWDAINWDNFSNDLNWMIGNTRCIIQGVGSFNNSKTYPLGLFIAETGDVKISLNSLENFETEIPVFIYDSLLDTYTKINELDYEDTIEGGEYEDRFYITFNSTNSSNLALSTDDFDLLEPSIKYLSSSKEISIKSHSESPIKALRLFDMVGKLLFQEDKINTNTYKKYINTTTTGNYIVSIETDSGRFSKILSL